MRLSTGYRDDGDGFYQKRLPKGRLTGSQTAKITFPSGRTADELCPTEPAALVWAAQLGTLTFHPWPVRSTGPRPSRRAAARPGSDSRGRRSADAQRIAAVARELLDELGLRAYPKTSGNTGDSHLPSDPARAGDFEEVRHAAIGFGGELERRDGWRNHQLVEGGARHARVLRLQPEQPGSHRSPAPGACDRGRGAPVSTPMSWVAVGRRPGPRRFQPATRFPTISPTATHGRPWTTPPTRLEPYSSSGRRSAGLAS